MYIDIILIIDFKVVMILCCLFLGFIFLKEKYNNIDYLNVDIMFKIVN